MPDPVKTGVTFSAIFAPKSAAMDFDHAGDGARITLDIPKSNMAELLQLPAYYAGRNLVVTIKVAKGDVCQGE